MIVRKKTSIYFNLFFILHANVHVKKDLRDDDNIYSSFDRYRAVLMLLFCVYCVVYS